MKEMDRAMFDENQQLSNDRDTDHLRMQIMRESLKLNDQDDLIDVLTYMQGLMQPENEILSVKEPELSYGKKVNDVRMCIMQESLQMNDDILLMYSLDYIRNYTCPEIHQPCQYSLDELKGVLRESQKAIKEGRVVAHKDIPKLYPQWFL